MKFKTYLIFFECQEYAAVQIIKQEKILIAFEKFRKFLALIGNVEAGSC